MTEIMFDLETLDTKPSAVILSIGAATFEKDGTINDRFYRVLEMQEQLDRGRTVSQSTLLWWLRQDINARDEAFAPVRCMVPQAIHDFNDFVSRYADPSITKFWCNGPSFDGVLWEDLCRTYTHVKASVPWRYNQLRDQRTLVDAARFSYDGFAPDIAGVAHNPVYDCEFQIAIITECRRLLAQKGGPQGKEVW
jgi:hypothetical protein